MLLHKLEEVGRSPTPFGTHLLWAGGAPIAANIAVQLGIPNRLWQEHGGWRSIRSTQGHVANNRELKLKMYRTMLHALAIVALPVGAHGPLLPFVYLTDSE